LNDRVSPPPTNTGSRRSHPRQLIYFSQLVGFDTRNQLSFLCVWSLRRSAISAPYNQSI